MVNKLNYDGKGGKGRDGVRIEVGTEGWKEQEV